jgi:hypothetical protein
MPRLTITLSEDRHRALKEAAARQGKTIRQLIEESLDAYGIRTMESAAALVRRARRRSGLSAEEAEDVAVRETAEVRRRRRRR